MNEEDIWLSEPEVIEILGVTRQTCYNLRKAGVLKYYSIEGKLRYNGNDIAEFIAQCKTPKLQIPKAPREIKPRQANKERLEIEKPVKPIATKPSFKSEDSDNYFI